MDPLLAASLELVLRDVRATTAIEFEVREESFPEAPRPFPSLGVVVMVYGPSGSGSGIHWDHETASADSTAELADEVQEFVIDELWDAGRSVSWPNCPEHPDSHPLKATVVDGRPVWQCPKSEAVVAPIGQL